MKKSWYQKYYEKSLSRRNLKIKEGNWYNVKNFVITEVIIGIFGLFVILLGYLLIGFAVIILMLLLSIWCEKNFFEQIKVK